MSVPDFQTFLRPVLDLLRDGNTKNIREIKSQIATELKISEADLNDLLPSGRQTRFNNRVAWAVSFLNAAKLVERPARSEVRITQRGIEELKVSPPRITVKYLMKFPEFQEFGTGQTTGANSSNESSEEQDSTSTTPLEQIEVAFERIGGELAQELLERVRSCHPSFFEKLVVDLLVAMGYGGSRTDAGRAIGKSGDEGIDGIISEDRLGLDLIYLQAKRWGEANPIARKEIDEFKGALDSKGATKGVFITTSRFNDAAKKAAESKNYKIVLIDGIQLCKLMIAHGVGVTTAQTYEIKKIDSDYFDEL